MVCRFGRFEFDLARGALSKRGRPVRLEPQPARALALLVSRAGDLVTRDDLRQHLWEPGVHVDFDRGLAYAMAQVRVALGDAADNPRFIETVPRHGYRFIAPVQVEPLPGSADAGLRGAGAELAPTARTEPTWSVGTSVAASPIAHTTDVARAQGAGLGVHASPLATTRWPVVLLCALVAVAVGWVAWNAWLPVRPVVAVALFDNETGRAEFDALAATAADVMVARLTALGAERMGVIGNTPRLRQPRADRDPLAVRDETGAGFLVFGQVQPDDAGVRLVVHLIRLDDQTHLWVTRVARNAADLRGIQDVAADRLAEAVRAHVLDRNPRAPRFTP